jgi:membrane AbrB-like protein
LAGLLFRVLGIPLPWLLGPFTGVMIFHSLSGGRGSWPIGFREAGLVVIGYSMGRTVTGEAARHIIADLPSMVAVTVLTVLFSAAAGYVTHRRTGVSLASGVLGSVPGGLAQMVVLAEEVRDADRTVVTLMQMTRVLALLFIVPFLASYGIAPSPAVGNPLPPVPSAGLFAPSSFLPGLGVAILGAVLAMLLNLPIPCLVGPIFGTAAAVLCGLPAAPVPGVLYGSAQIFFGVYMGLGFNLGALRSLGIVTAYAVGGAVALVGFTLLLGFGLTFLTHFSLLTGFLSTAPGGMAEMGILAVTLHADIVSVVAYQAFRLFSILLVVPPFLKKQFNR